MVNNINASGLVKHELDDAEQIASAHSKHATEPRSMAIPSASHIDLKALTPIKTLEASYKGDVIGILESAHSQFFKILSNCRVTSHNNDIFDYNANKTRLQGVDKVHSILKHLLSNAQTSLHVEIAQSRLSFREKNALKTLVSVMHSVYTQQIVRLANTDFHFSLMRDFYKTYMSFLNKISVKADGQIAARKMLNDMQSSPLGLLAMGFSIPRLASELLKTLKPYAVNSKVKPDLSNLNSRRTCIANVLIDYYIHDRTADHFTIYELVEILPYEKLAHLIPSEKYLAIKEALAELKRHFSELHESGNKNVPESLHTFAFEMTTSGYGTDDFAVRYPNVDLTRVMDTMYRLGSFDKAHYDLVDYAAFKDYFLHFENPVLDFQLSDINPLGELFFKSYAKYTNKIFENFWAEQFKFLQKQDLDIEAIADTHIFLQSKSEVFLKSYESFVKDFTRIPKAVQHNRAVVENYMDIFLDSKGVLKNAEGKLYDDYNFSKYIFDEHQAIGRDIAKLDKFTTNLDTLVDFKNLHKETYFKILCKNLNQTPYNESFVFKNKGDARLYKPFLIPAALETLGMDDPSLVPGGAKLEEYITDIIERTGHLVKTEIERLYHEEMTKEKAYYKAREDQALAERNKNIYTRFANRNKPLEISKNYRIEPKKSVNAIIAPDVATRIEHLEDLPLPDIHKPVKSMSVTSVQMPLAQRQDKTADSVSGQQENSGKTDVKTPIEAVSESALVDQAPVQRKVENKPEKNMTAAQEAEPVVHVAKASHPVEHQQSQTVHKEIPQLSAPQPARLKKKRLSGQRLSVSSLPSLNSFQTTAAAGSKPESVSAMQTEAATGIDVKKKQEDSQSFRSLNREPDVEDWSFLNQQEVFADTPLNQRASSAYSAMGDLSPMKEASSTDEVRDDVNHDTNQLQTEPIMLADLLAQLRQSFASSVSVSVEFPEKITGKDRSDRSSSFEPYDATLKIFKHELPASDSDESLEDAIQDDISERSASTVHSITEDFSPITEESSRDEVHNLGHVQQESVKLADLIVKLRQSNAPSMSIPVELQEDIPDKDDILGLYATFKTRNATAEIADESPASVPQKNSDDEIQDNISEQSASTLASKTKPLPFGIEPKAAYAESVADSYFDRKSFHSDEYDLFDEAEFNSKDIEQQGNPFSEDNIFSPRPFETRLGNIDAVIASPVARVESNMQSIRDKPQAVKADKTFTGLHLRSKLKSIAAFVLNMPQRVDQLFSMRTEFSFSEHDQSNLIGFKYPTDNNRKSVNSSRNFHVRPRASEMKIVPSPKVSIESLHFLPLIKPLDFSDWHIQYGYRL